MKWSIQMPKAHGIAAAAIWPRELRERVEPAEVVDRADDAGDRRAEHDPAHLPVEREERERRHEDPEEDREPAEPRDRTLVERRPPGGSTTPRSRAIPPTAGVRSTTITNAISAPQRTSGFERSSSNTIAPYFVP